MAENINVKENVPNRESISKYLQQVKRVVIKAGTTSLTHGSGKLNFSSIEKLVRQIADLHNKGIEVVLVSSGAVGAGMGKLNLKEKPTDISKKQALAAIGQGLLMQTYEKFFAEYGITAAQVLLTGDDIASRDRFLNARNTFAELRHYGVIPIVNENDTVAFKEIKVGDNDTLASLVATVIEADLLVLLTDIDGLYSGDPRYDKNACKIEVVKEISEDIISAAGGKGSALGTGGMATKVQAAQIGTSCGIPMVLTDSSTPNVLTLLFEGECTGTVFLPKKEKFEGRKGWLAFASRSAGKILVDEGAKNALVQHGSSLLAKGIVEVEGKFNRGDIVSILFNEEEIARGVVNYNNKEVKKVKGKHSEEFVSILEEVNELEIVHRDNMSLLKS